MNNMNIHPLALALLCGCGSAFTGAPPDPPAPDAALDSAADPPPDSPVLGSLRPDGAPLPEAADPAADVAVPPPEAALPDPPDAPAEAPAGPCGPGLTWCQCQVGGPTPCSQGCTDLSADLQNCGACFRACAAPGPGAYAVCVSGACSVVSGCRQGTWCPAFNSCISPPRVCP